MYDVKPTTSRRSTDCGAACMVSFLEYYGVETTLEDMIKECNIQISGCSAKDLMDAGRNHGLPEMKAYKMDAEELVRQDRPAICWWKYNHWVIFCGMDGDKVVICNPSRGRYGLSASLFRAFYSGISVWNGEPHDLPEGV